jgi:hypothetical protein
MDNISRYYLKKAQLRAPDEFQSCITPGDVEHLQKSRAYLLITPLMMIGGFHLFRLMWESSIITRSFAQLAFRARSTKAEQKWDPESKTYRSTS